MEVKQGWRDCNEINRAPTGAESAEPCSTALPHWGFVSGHVVGNLRLVSILIKSGFPPRIMMTLFQLYDEHLSKIIYLKKKISSSCLYCLTKIWNVMSSFAWAHVGVNHAIALTQLAYDWFHSQISEVHTFMINNLFTQFTLRKINMCVHMSELARLNTKVLRALKQ